MQRVFCSSELSIAARPLGFILVGTANAATRYGNARLRETCVPTYHLTTTHSTSPNFTKAHLSRMFATHRGHEMPVEIACKVHPNV